MKLTQALCLTLAVAGTGLAFAQDSQDAMKPPAVIQITREWLKPGKSGAIHDKSEAAFVSVMNRSRVQGHYIALNSMSGKSRALYMTRYDSYAAWESDNKVIEKNASISAELDRDAVADGELLEGLDQAVLTYVESMSFHPRPDFSHARYYQIMSFHVRPGHTREWHEVTKMYKDACEKAGAGIHWGMYQVAFGGDGGTYIALTHRDSLTELDTEMADGKKLMEAMGGEEGMSKFDELFGQAVDSSHTELFSINPKQSFVDESTAKADPDFWKPKAAAPKAQSAAAAKPTASPKPASR
ncbi:MAG TPA: hypothetical protein VGI45_15940 [Terracidiphilus sp.]|jgi:hypothetical protein